ncbi:hypothetical protein [Nitrospirillum sp. BR 11163]|uniref:hypothetical protein n=1 Tax=Nitrospirillum sp. BR 11163 TaxID=3104323 RepID=UPI002AFF723F|nr:hypothetical protein [Nitrospirillum sp. BR 11163]MEA1675163.1 hypothetical protein [Nitrospirillum sp. BR 11163]
MRSALPPLLLLYAALALSLASAPRRGWGLNLAVLAVAAGVTATVPPPWRESVFTGCWISVAMTAVAGLVCRTDRQLAWGLSLNAGLWSGALAAVTGEPLDLLVALPTLGLLPAAAWTLRRLSFPVVRVMSSWLVAVAVLAIALACLPVTPGYLPDHLE